MTPPATADRSLRAYFALAWPIVVARATQAVIGFSDAIMTAPLGEEAFTAATTGAMNTMNLVILPMGIVFLVQSFSAQLFGAGMAPAARRYAIYGLVFALLVEAATIASLGAIEPALSLFNFEDGVRDGMTEYLQWRLFGIGAIVGSEALGNYRGGLGDTKTPMIANIIAMISNIALNAIFIYGYLGAPALGVRGAALASALASGAGFLYLLIAFAREPVARAQRGALAFDEFARLLRFGIPSGLNWFLEFAAFTFFVNVIVAKLGTASVGALMAVIQVNSLSFMPAFGFASAGAIFVGQAIGNRDLDAVPALVRRTAIVMGAWQVFVGLNYLLFPGFIMSIFGASPNASVEVLQIGVALLPLSAAWQLFDAIAMAVSEALRAAGDTAWTLWARIVCAWTLFVPGAWLWIGSASDGGAAAISCIVIYVAVLSVVFLLRFRAGAWRRIDLTGATQLSLAPQSQV